MLLGPLDRNRTELLHVGSTIPRKRIDVLLEIFAALRHRNPTVHLVRVGDTFTRNQERLVASLGLAGHITVLRFVDRRVLAAIYRRAVLLLQPSDREGFGLPVAEAMACGTPVVASDLPALREVGGGAATYCPVGDIARWSNSVAELLRERDNDVEAWRVRRAAGTAQARRFNWPEHARRMMDVYRELLNEIASRDATARPLVFADAKRRGA
jgi:glycosyltransferase involved in cell wall biosynthesis